MALAHINPQWYAVTGGKRVSPGESVLVIAVSHPSKLRGKNLCNVGEDLLHVGAPDKMSQSGERWSIVGMYRPRIIWAVRRAGINKFESSSSLLFGSVFCQPVDSIYFLIFFELSIIKYTCQCVIFFIM